MQNRFLLGIGILISLWSCKGKQQEVQPVKNDITETVFASGMLVANDRYNLTAQSEGYLIEVPVKEGDVLLAQTLVARIENTSSDAGAAAAEKQLNIAKQNTTDLSPAVQEMKVNVDLAEQKMNQEKKQADRYQTLYQSQSVSKLEWENAQLAYESAKANWNSAKKRLAQIQQQAEWTKASQDAAAAQQRNASGFNMVKALSNGRVIKLMKKVGDYVRKGDVIAVMAGTDQMVAQLNVDENSIKKIKQGQRAHIQLNVDKGKVLEGTVATMYPLYDEASQSFVCDVVFEKPLEFDVIGTRLEANIDVASRKQVLLIPRIYLSYSNTVQVKGEEEPRKVEAGIRSTEWVEIKSGITEQDVLIPLKK